MINFYIFINFVPCLKRKTAYKIQQTIGTTYSTTYSYTGGEISTTTKFVFYK